MSTTTLRLPEDIKARIDKLAQSCGKSPHAFMVDSLVAATDALERRQDFEAEAERRLQHMQETGEYLTMDDVRAYAAALAQDQSAPRPAARTMSAEELARFRASMRRAAGA